MDIKFDIKNFLENDKFEKNYNVVIRTENEILKDHKNGEIINLYQGLYNIASLEFVITDVPTDVTSYITEYDKIKENIALFGPQVKKCFISTDNIPIKKIVYASILSKNVTIDQEKSDNTSGVTIIIDKQNYVTPSHAILSKQPCDRVALINNAIYVSGSFLLELCKYKTSDYTCVDPIFKYPADIFNVFDHSQNKDGIENIIRSVDLEKIQLAKNLQNTFIQHDDNKYTPIEYAILRTTQIKNSVVMAKLMACIVHLAKIKYIRPPFLVANSLEIQSKYPHIYDIVTTFEDTSNDTYRLVPISAKINSTGSLTYCIDMFIMHQIIIKDNDDLFVEYAAKTGYIKKMGSTSNTTTTIIDWLIKCNATKIITALIKCNVFDEFNKTKLCLASKNIEFLDERIILAYKNGNSDDELCLPLLDHIDTIIKYNAASSLLFLIKLFPAVASGGITTPTMEQFGGNLLHTIKADDNASIVDLLLRVNSKSHDIRDKYGRTPLLVYAEEGLEKCFFKMLDSGSSIYVSDNNGDTILHKLCYFGHLHILQKSVRQLAELVNVQNNFFETPAIIAAKQKNEDILNFLKGHNADLSCTDQYGNTAYHYMCSNELCIGSIIVNKKNNFGFTPADYCTLAKNFYYFVD